MRPDSTRVRLLYNEFKEKEADLIESVVKLWEDLRAEEKDKAIPCLQRADLIDQMIAINQKAIHVRQLSKDWERAKAEADGLKLQ